jgi:hypothetical protein
MTITLTPFKKQYCWGLTVLCLFGAIIGLPITTPAQPNNTREGRVFLGISPSIAHSTARLSLEADVVRDHVFRWGSSDPIVGDIDTDVVSAIQWVLTGAGPNRLVFVWTGNGATIFGDVLFEPYNRAVVDVVKGAKRVRYTLAVQQSPCARCCAGATH